MITRSKLVEQLRDYQIRSQYKSPFLTFFSPKPILSSRTDVAVAIFCALLFSMFIILSLVTLYFRYVLLSFLLTCVWIFLSVRLRRYKKALTRKGERRMLLPLSM